jgi:lysophospholipase L1-like esterase
MPSPLRVVGRLAAAMAVFAAQVLRSAHRQDLPSHNNQDPSGVFGDPTSPLLRIVLVGDSSITAPGVVPLDDCWPRRLAYDLEGQYQVVLRSVARGGAKARALLADQIPLALEEPADMALVSVGANDVLRATPVARFEREFNAIISILRREIRMVGIAGIGDLGTLPRLPDLARTLARVRARSFDEAIGRVAARHPGVLKSRSWGAGWEPFTTHAHFAFAQDQFHASGAGHGMFAASVIPVVEGLLAAPERVSEWPGNLGSTT